MLWCLNYTQVAALRSNEAKFKKKKGCDGRKTKEKEVMHIVKTQFGLRSIAFR